MYPIFFIHSSVNGLLGCFLVFAIVNSAALNIGMLISFRIKVFIFSKYVHRSGIAGSCGSSTFSFTVLHSDSFPGSTSKELACQCRRHKRCGFDPWVRKSPWRRTWQPSPVFLPGESLGQRSLEGYSP